ncbi:hypothetical protein ACFL27_13645 [candidate division CSSED10-310 bacterium]|uniref:Uncharacterized protein n=1 Tax=candidate division CSSED10-310 bacterium TaxID=2855610 RepID=A0ABV6YYH0_UNCC1
MNFKKAIFFLMVVVVPGLATADFQVNTYTTYNQRRPAVAVDNNGDFVVVWKSYGSNYGDSSSPSIQGQRYASDGSFLGSQFQVNNYTTNIQDSPKVAVESNGDFVVVWNSDGSNYGDVSGESSQGQRFDSNGNFIDSQFQINTYTTNNQKFPEVSMNDDRDFVVVWSSNGSAQTDTSSYSIQAKQFRFQTLNVPVLSSIFIIMLPVLLGAFGVFYLFIRKTGMPNN